MSLTRKQIDEIARFDAAHRPNGRWLPTWRTLRYNYIVPDEGGSPRTRDVTVVHVAVRLDGERRAVVKDVGRWDLKTGRLTLRDIDYHGLGGWIVGWRASEGWRDGGAFRFGAGLTFPWHATVNPDALKGTRYAYCRYSDEARCKAGLVGWLMLYRQEPKVELLAKAGLHALICPAGLAALKSRRVRDWVLAHRDELARVRHKVRDVLYAARHGLSSVAAAEKLFDLAASVRRWLSTDWERPRLDYVRLAKALPKWGVDASEYARYLNHAHGAGLDLRNEGTLYPPTAGGRAAFMARLEALERAEARKRRAQAAARRKRLAEMMEVRAAELEAFQRSLDRVRTLKGCGYVLVLAKTQKELLAEGKRMHNCVGCGTYGEGIVAGDLLIVMLRDADGKSFCDIEISRRSWTVRQCYLKRNERAPQDVRTLADRIAAALKAEHARHRRRRLFAAPEGKAA